MKQHLSKLIFGFSTMAAVVGANTFFERTVCDPARSEIRAIYNDIGALWTSKTVLDRAAKYPALRIHLSADEITISEPLRFGATNWVMIIDVQEPHLRSVRIRTQDGVRFKPDDAPEDRLLAAE